MDFLIWRSMIRNDFCVDFLDVHDIPNALQHVSRMPMMFFRFWGTLYEVLVNAPKEAT